MLKRFLAWLDRLFTCKSSESSPPPIVPFVSARFIRYVAQTSDDAPEEPVAGVLHLIEDGAGTYWLAVMRCPCGCRATIQLPMTPPARPCWHFHGTSQKPSLWPSVRRATGCKSHFILRDGVVQWCRDI